VIKPPVKKISSGRIFKPSRSFLYKEILKLLTIAIVIYLGTVGTFAGFAKLIYTTGSEDIPDYDAYMNQWYPSVSYWTIVLDLLWLIPALVLIPFYVKSIEYSVKSETGETMPEIYVKKGIVTVTRKHVPFRTITNIGSYAGPFDRVFKIGNVNIETAGYSGKERGPEEKLEGTLFYEEVRDFILAELRRYRAPYALGTEINSRDEPVPRTEGLDDEILITLREIRDLLKKRTIE
jgi:hypothetical protein